MPSTTQSRAARYIGTSQGKAGQQDSPSTPHPDYVDMFERWELVSDLMGGTPSMRAAGEKWLRKFPNESAAVFKKRLQVTTLFNVFGGTVASLVGRVFREPIKLTEETDPRIEQWSQDIDRQGRDLNGYGRDCLTDMLVFGKCHTMPEYPNTDELKEALGKQELNLADEQDNDVRPFFSKVTPISLFAWLGSALAGRERLEQVRLAEQEWVRSGTWGYALKKTIRVVTPNGFQIFTLVDKEWQPGPEISTTLGEVNLLSAYARRTGFLISAPVLEDLAWLNQKHWNSQSDQDNILHVVRAAILLVKGITKQDMKYIEVGPSLAIRTDSVDASVQFVEHSGKGIEAGAHSLAALTEEMQASGAGDLLMPKPGNETATARALSEAKTLSPLQAMALNLQDHLEECFKMCGAWIKEPDISVGVRVNTDMGPVSEAVRELELLQKDADAGRISTEDYLKEAQARGLYDAETDIEELLANAKAEADEAATALVFAPSGQDEEDEDEVEPEANGDA